MLDRIVDSLCTTLQSRNVVVNQHRTSMRLEPEMWSALQEIAEREKVSLNRLCSMVDSNRNGSSLTSSMRVFVLAYFRTAAMDPFNRTILDSAIDRGSPQPPLRAAKRNAPQAPLLGASLSAGPV